MHFPVMLRAQRDQVVQIGLASIRPMPDVVGMHITGPAAAGKAAAAVANAQRIVRNMHDQLMRAGARTAPRTRTAPGQKRWTMCSSASARR